jgi:hypothetical protein
MNAQLRPLDARPIFARECVADVEDGISFLVQEHYDEVTHHRDIPPGIDFDKFKRLESGGVLRVFTVRVAGELVGYAIFTVGFSMHYSSSLQSRQDTLFLSAAYRKGLTGYKFIKWCDEQLMAEGVECGYQHGKFVKNIESIYERMGYEPVYYVYMKRFKTR